MSLGVDVRNAIVIAVDGEAVGVVGGMRWLVEFVEEEEEEYVEDECQLTHDSRYIV